MGSFAVRVRCSFEEVPLRCSLAVGRSFALVFGLAMLGGCLVTSNSHTTHSGTSVSQSTFEQITPGQTTTGWVRSTLGNPDSKSQAVDDEVWRYSYTERTDSSGQVFLLFGSSSTSEHTSNAYVEFKEGVVVKKWRD